MPVSIAANCTRNGQDLLMCRGL